MKLAGKILRVTRDSRVTRKSIHSDCSAGSQCDSAFTKPAETYLVGLTTVTLPPKLRSLLWNAA